MAPWYVLTSRLGTSPQPAYNTNGHPVLDTYLGGPQLSLDLFRVDIGTGISIVSLSARSCHLCCSTANLSPALLPANDVEPNATAHILVTSLPQPFSTIPAESMARTLMTGRARALPSSRPTASVRLHAAIEVNCSAANTPRRGPAKLRTRRRVRLRASVGRQSGVRNVADVNACHPTGRTVFVRPSLESGGLQGVFG